MGISLAPEQSVEDPLKPKKDAGLQAPKTAAAPSGIPLPTVAAPSQPVDRVKLATDIFNTTAASTQGAYDAARSDNVRSSAAMGQVASGGLRTREGNLQLARGRDLDLLRRNVTNDAVAGSIEDANTAFSQDLAGKQFGLSSELGRGGLDLQRERDAVDAKYKEGSLTLAQRNQAQAEIAQRENLALEKERLSTSTRQTQEGLELEKRRLEIGSGQTQQQIDLQKQRDEIDARFRAGTMSLAEKEQALRELSNQQQFGLQISGLELAREIQRGNLTLAQAQQKIDEAYRNKTITLAERSQALAELAQSQGNQNEQQRIQLAKDQLAQTGQQFGLSLAQQRDLATLADKTQNRQLDIASAQGRNSLLLELARIMGGTSGNVDPSFLQAVMAALGFGGATPPPPDPTPPTPGAHPPGNPPAPLGDPVAPAPRPDIRLADEYEKYAGRMVN